METEDTDVTNLSGSVACNVRVQRRSAEKRNVLCKVEAGGPDVLRGEHAVEGSIVSTIGGAGAFSSPDQQDLGFELSWPSFLHY